MEKDLKNQLQEQQKEIEKLKKAISVLERRVAWLDRNTARAKESARQNAMNIDKILAALRRK